MWASVQTLSCVVSGGNKRQRVIIFSISEEIQEEINAILEKQYCLFEAEIDVVSL